MNTRVLTALFDSRADAEQACQSLGAIGITAGRVRIVDSAGDGSAQEAGADGKGLWEKVKDFFGADSDDRRFYEEGMRRGAYLLHVEIEEPEVDRACAILEQSSAIDLQSRESQWRAEGWGSETSGIETGGMGNQVSATAAPDPESSPMTQRDSSSATSADGSMSDRSVSGEETIPVVEERMRVGKREVGRGGVRVRSYVVDEPVHEQVRLREERAEIERRPVNQPVRGEPGDLLQERTVEVAETAEEAVVEKEAVVTEEVAIRKRADERVEEIDETLRHTEVEVDDDRGQSPPPKRRRQQDQPERRR